MKTIRIDINNLGVAFLFFDVPDRPVNIFTPDLEADLAAAIQLVTENSAVRGLVLTSAKSNSFIAGADLKDIARIYGRESVRQVYNRSATLSALFRRIETCGKPVACAINGLALGAGLELALACHYRLIADNRRAVIGLPEVTVGLLPGAGGTQRLPRLIGIPKALPILLDGKPLSPTQAVEMGIVQKLLPEDQLLTEAQAWVLEHPSAVAPWDVKGFKLAGGVGSLASHAPESFQAGTSRQAQATNRNYPAPLAILSCVFEGTQVPFETGLRIESKYFAKLATGPVARNLIRTNFINKGAADKLIRRPAGFPKRQVRKLGVFGAGMMGAGIAYVSASTGVEVLLFDKNEEAAEKGKAFSKKLLAKALEKGHKTQDQADTLLARILPTTDFAQLSGCDMVIEAVFENREIKRDVIEKTAVMAGPDTVFASNTSTLPITSLAQNYPWEDRFIGIHFFSPVERMPLVEIIRGRRTSDETLASAMDFVEQLRKTPIVVNDSPGFFTSRVFGTYVDEGMAMLAEGIEPALIENAARLAGMAVGPLAVCDEVTIELQLKVHEQAVADGLPAKFQRLTAISVVRKMVNEFKRTGRRTGAGFYEYPVGQKKHLWPGLRDAFPATRQQPNVEEVKTRLLYIQAMESVRCLEEGVVEHAMDADIGSILGLGYPSWTGGPISLIDTVGVGAFVAECERLASAHGTRFKPSEALHERARRSHPFYEDA